MFNKDFEIHCLVFQLNLMHIFLTITIFKYHSL
uniref:Uncharacterized protein n=1 Tax=Anguilla anguilla TaxID=7936 RepID=A0A0E9PIN7_ANGAN